MADDGRPSAGMDHVDEGPPTNPVTIDGLEIAQLGTVYGNRVTPEEWDQVVETAASILGRCPKPTADAGRATGLALGKVQSGKTLSYTALVALAADNRYRITVVLAGTKNPLLDQNYERLRRDLTMARPTITPFRNPAPQDAEVIRSVLHGGGHALIVALKQRKRIEGVRMALSVAELRGQPILIIDDEGDEASLNTQFRRGRQSAIYASILQLRDNLRLHAYLAYTATPQANLLISGIDALSPDFAVLVQPGAGYCGGSRFFGTERDHYIRIVPIAEASAPPSEIGDVLRQAMAVFFVGAALRHAREPRAWHSMLVHNSDRRADHDQLDDSVRALVGLWRDTLGLSADDPARAELMGLFKRAYDDLAATVRDAPPWERISAALRDEVVGAETWMVNSLPTGRDPVGTPFRLPNNILVGGNMLGRGVTVEGLAVTYITRRAQGDTNADTMEQRARWFGYKERYLDLCRIYLTAQLRDDYTEILQHEDDFWAALQRTHRQGLSVRDWPRLLRLNMAVGIRPTRANVANYRQFRAVGWDIQNRLVDDEARASRNVDVAREFFARRTVQSRRFGNVNHLLVENCPTEEVIRDLLAHLNTEGTDWENAYVAEYLARLLVGGRLLSLDVVFMAEGADRERGRSDGRVNPMQGRSPGRQPGDRQFYPGDENLHGNEPQLQVHMIYLRGAEVPHPMRTTALALYIPANDPRYDLHHVVRDPA